MLPFWFASRRPRPGAAECLSLFWPCEQYVFSLRDSSLRSMVLVRFRSAVRGNLLLLQRCDCLNLADSPWSRTRAEDSIMIHLEAFQDFRSGLTLLAGGDANGALPPLRSALYHTPSYP